MKWKKKIIYLSIYFFTILSAFSISSAAYKLEGIGNFPESYQPYLKELQNKYPNWSFTALYTELDWKYVIDNENIFGKNLVPKSYSDNWKNTKKGEYNVEVDAGWVDCSRQAIEYTMDPRNFLNYVRIFQFEGLSYNATTNNLEGIEKILYGTELYSKIVEYVTSSGTNITTSSKYSDLILSAGRQSLVSVYHLASRIRQEVGPFLTHSSISGRVAGYEGLYNFYNIGATSSSEEMGAIKNGLQYAKDGKGASQITKDKYLIPWNTKEKAITGGAIFIGSSYINVGQDTIYLQKFHVTNTTSNELFWHQYMTNVLAPYSESKSIYKGYENINALNNSINFIIPIYINMPEIPVESPNILSTDYTSDNTKVYANVQTTLNVRSGPSTSYEILASVSSGAQMTRIAKGKQSGELWDRVILSNGMVGYVFQSYLKEVPKVQIQQINVSIDNTILAKGETEKLQVEILPEEASNHEIEYLSSDKNVIQVDSEGNVYAIGAGKSIITVKAKENNVSTQIELEVIAPVTDMELSVTDLTLQIGENFIINPIIYPEDANNKNVTYYVKDTNILKVDAHGKITALNVGKTIIIVTTEDGNISKQVAVSVIEKIEDEELSFDESLKVESNQITGWNIQNLKVNKIKELIQTNYQIKIYNHKGEELGEDDTAGTGSTIIIMDEQDVIKIGYEIVIYGDVNGDGKINSIDLLVLQRHILEIEKLTGPFLVAGNINKNGKNPSSLDSLLIQRHILELQIIEQ